jgi:hypothetical protein
MGLVFALTALLTSYRTLLYLAYGTSTKYEIILRKTIYPAFLNVKFSCVRWHFLRKRLRAMNLKAECIDVTLFTAFVLFLKAFVIL